jgi:hypothetical protein
LIDAASVVPPGFAADADPLDAAAGVRPLAVSIVTVAAAGAALTAAEVTLQPPTCPATAAGGWQSCAEHTPD